MIKNIIFDIGSVLVEFNPEKTLRKMGLPEEEVTAIANATSLNPIWKELDRGVMDREDVFKMMMEKVPDQYKKDAEDFLHNHIMETVESYDYADSWLKDLKFKGYKIYLLSNYPGWMFDYHWYHTFTFTESIDGKVVSSFVRQIKPDYEIYRTLLREYNLLPEECIFIDDRADNIKSAIELGINGIQFTNIVEVKSELNAILSRK